MQREEPPVMTTGLERIAVKAGYRHTVNQRLKSPVREIRTLGSVGAGGE